MQDRGLNIYYLHNGVNSCPKIKVHSGDFQPVSSYRNLFVVFLCKYAEVLFSPQFLAQSIHGKLVWRDISAFRFPLYSRLGWNLEVHSLTLFHSSKCFKYRMSTFFLLVSCYWGCDQSTNKNLFSWSNTNKFRLKEIFWFNAVQPILFISPIRNPHLGQQTIRKPPYFGVQRWAVTMSLWKW